jgi:iron complex outermembrane recepter protein
MLVFASLASLNGIGQSACSFTIEGAVKDAETKEILGSADVLIKELKKGTVSNAQGGFQFKKVCAGSYTLTCSFVGYKTLTTSVNLAENIVHDFFLEADTRLMNEITVADKAEHLAGVQTSVVLNERKLAEAAGKTLGEVLKDITGVNSIQSGPGIFKPVIHGVHSQRILILNYGIRQEGQQWGAEHAPEIDPFIASNIVVVKDASAIKYGSDALGGVVIVNPPELPEKSGLKGSVHTIAQSNGRSGTLSGTLEGGIKKYDGWGWRIQGTAKRVGDFKTPTYYLRNSGVKELNFSGAAGYHSKTFGIEAFFSHFKTELGILKGTSIGSINDLLDAMERDVPQYTSGFSYSIGEPRQEVSHNLAKLNAHVETKKGNWRIQYSFQNNNRKEFDIRIGDLSKVPSINLQLNTHTLETEFELKTKNNGSLCWGLSGMVQNNENIPGTQRIPFIPEFTNLSAGVFAISKLKVKDWIIDLGARYDYRQYSVSGFDFKNTLYKDQLVFNNPSATIGTTKDFGKNQSVSMSLSSAWRPPHVAELYSSGTHQSAASTEYGLLLNGATVMSLEAASFKIENALKWVATYRYSTPKFQIEASTYLNYIFNFIYLKPIGIGRGFSGPRPSFQYTQTDASFTGIDLSAIWNILPTVKINPKASLLRATDERNNDYLVFIPTNRFDLSVRFEPMHVGLKYFFVEAKPRYIAHQTRAPRVITVREINDAKEQGLNLFETNPTNFDFIAAPNGYFLFNAATGFSIVQPNARYDFRVAAENIANTIYREYTNRFRYYANEIGSNYTFSIKCIF